MAAGVTSRLWEIGDIVDVLEAWEGNQKMKKRRDAFQTQWAAQFAVASELCRRNYKVALTLGNHPMIDLMVVSPNDAKFNVDVKGQYSDKPWGLQ